MNESLTIRVVTFREGDLFIAQALEVDVCAQGRSMEEARRRLEVTLHAEAREAKSAGKTLIDIGPAPTPFHALYENSEVERSLSKVA